MNQRLPVCTLTLHGLGLLFLGVEYAELEFGPHFRLVAGDQEEVEGEVVLRVFVKSLGVDPQAPLHLVILRRESGRLQDFAKVLSCEGEVGDSPHVRKLHHLHLHVKVCERQNLNFEFQPKD